MGKRSNGKQSTQRREKIKQQSWPQPEPKPKKPKKVPDNQGWRYA